MLTRTESEAGFRVQQYGGQIIRSPPLMSIEAPVM
jgi:hypothetical protein